MQMPGGESLVELQEMLSTERSVEYEQEWGWRSWQWTDHQEYVVWILS